MKPFHALVHVIAVMSLTACASSGGGNNSTVAPTPDPRVGLKPGLKDAGHASWNLRLINNTPPSEKFVGSTNSDLAFYKNYVIQGNYNGYEVWDITSPTRPTLKVGYFCPASQSDVSVFRNLLFVSGEGTGGRLDCTAAGVHDSVSHDRLRGIRIFDISDIANPKYIANVQTCRGSHTHTVGAARMRAAVARFEPEQLAVPHRGHQGAARRAAAGRGGGRGPHLRLAHAGADARRDAAGHRRSPPRGGLSASEGCVHGDAVRDGAGGLAALCRSAARQRRQSA